MKRETLARRGWETKRIQRTKKKGQNGLKPTNEKQKIVHEYCGRKHNKIANEKTIKLKHDTRVMANKPGKHVTVFFFLTN